MENIYKPRINKLTNIKKFQNDFKQLPLLPQGVKSIPATDEDIKRAMNFTGTDDEFQNLQDAISLELHLSSLDDVRVVDYDPGALKSSFRKTQIALQKESLKLNRIQEVLKKSLSPNDWKAQIMFQQRIKILPRSEFNGKPDLTVHNEVVLTVNLYEPYRHVPGVRLQYHPKFTQEYVCLGTNYLHELRDKIICQCNKAPFLDISENPWNDDETNACRPKTNPGFFFITDTFYNDMRDKANMDYSECIREWAQGQPDIDELKVKKMEETRFNDLEFHMGYPHVYQHHDILYREPYPILTSISRSRFKNCFLCGRNEAAWIIRGSTAHIQDPSYLCNRCFESYHYVDRQKIGKFEAYRYYGSTCIT